MSEEMATTGRCPLFDDDEHDRLNCRWCWGLEAADHTDDDVVVHLTDVARAVLADAVPDRDEMDRLIRGWNNDSEADDA